MNEINWELVGYVKASRYRKEILLSLRKGNKTPKELKTKLDLYITHVSSTLKELMEKKLVKCLTPNLRKGRIFALTKIGINLLEYV